MISDIGKLWDKSKEIRLNTLKILVKDKPKKIENGWVNLHIHTNESFSVFNSPSEAVWHAYNEDIEYFGINDHYTTNGYKEFEEACNIAGIKPVFSIEAVSMNNEFLEKNIRFNDPDNPGRTYIVGKGVTRSLEKGSKGYKILNTMREAIQNRNRNIVEKINKYLIDNGYNFELSYEDVRNLTPKGNATERHVVEAFCNLIKRSIVDMDKQIELYIKLLNVDINRDILNDPQELQTIVRSRLVKNGMPCYVEEDEKAFTSIENLVGIYREYGAIPTYPLLGTPITEAEKGIEELIDNAKAHGLYAFDLFDFRTEKYRAKEVVEIAKENGFPVFIGTEHNTKRMIPIVGELGKNPDLYGYFRKSAQFVYGHQVLSRFCNYNFLNSEGKPVIDNLKEGIDVFAHAGEMELSEEKVIELEHFSIEERKKFFDIKNL